jgi:hypothetical protein
VTVLAVSIPGPMVALLSIVFHADGTAAANNPGPAVGVLATVLAKASAATQKSTTLLVAAVAPVGALAESDPFFTPPATSNEMTPPVSWTSMISSAVTRLPDDSVSVMVVALFAVTVHSAICSPAFWPVCTSREVQLPLLLVIVCVMVVPPVAPTTMMRLPVAGELVNAHVATDPLGVRFGQDLCCTMLVESTPLCAHPFVGKSSASNTAIIAIRFTTNPALSDAR